MRLVQVPPRKCARVLDPGEVKRYPNEGALFGYYVACPSCGFRALHDDEAGFSESDGKLTGSREPLPCMSCGKQIRIHDGQIE